MNQRYQIPPATAVSMAANVRAYLELMRLKNVFLAAITVPLGAQFAIGDSWIDKYLIEVLLQVMAVIFFIGAGNTMNDIKDVDIDREAHPERPLASGAISIDNARTFVKMLWSLSIICLMIGAHSLHNNDKSVIELLTIYVIAVILMLTYDHGPVLKNTGLKIDPEKFRQLVVENETSIGCQWLIKEWLSKKRMDERFYIDRARYSANSGDLKFSLQILDLLKRRFGKKVVKASESLVVKIFNLVVVPNFIR